MNTTIPNQHLIGMEYGFQSYKEGKRTIKGQRCEVIEANAEFVRVRNDVLGTYTYPVSAAEAIYQEQHRILRKRAKKSSMPKDISIVTVKD